MPKTQNKIYYPEVIENNALPGTVEEETNEQGVRLVGVIPQETTPDVAFPVREYAREVLSKTLNTQSKKILGEYTFSPNGALAIGEYVSGSSGDIRITPDGITARDSTGATTFAIDGTTGDATFAGTITADVVVAVGALVVGTNVGLGTAQDSAGVTTIVGNTVTTGFVNALSVTAGDVNAENINAGTLTGHTFRTSSSGVRVELTANDAIVKWYDAGNDKVGEIDDNGTDFFIKAYDGRHLALSADGAGRVYCNDTLDMNGNDIQSLDVLKWNTRSSNPSDSWALYMYNNSGYSLRTRMSGGTWSVDQTSA